MWLALVSLLLTQTPQNDLERLQGEWSCSLQIRSGQKSPEEAIETIFREIKNDEMVISLFDKPLQKMKFKLNEKTSPKEIDVEFLDGPNKGKTALGIYEVNGDEFKICNSNPGNPRPTAFESKEGTPTAYSVWKRSKK
jgi:uncharacterized protein (TIGR03067 family)